MQCPTTTHLPTKNRSNNHKSTKIAYQKLDWDWKEKYRDRRKGRLHVMSHVVIVAERLVFGPNVLCNFCPVSYPVALDTLQETLVSTFSNLYLKITHLILIDCRQLHTSSSSSSSSAFQSRWINGKAKFS